MKEKKEIPWELIISTAFSGFGIAVLSWLKDMLTDFFTIDFLQKYGNIVVGLISFIVSIIVIWINYLRMKRKFRKRAEDLENNFNSSLDEIEAEREYVEKTLAIAQYANRKYEELDEYYKKIASYISVESKISDSFIMQYMDKIKNIVIDNTSTKDGENINVSLFQSKKEQKETYTIRLSNYHTVAKMKELEYKRKSFVGNVFKEKKVLYIPNIDERKPGDIFMEKQGRSYNTILGVPYIVDDVCIAVIVITMKEAGSLDYLYSECLNILQRYVQVVGLSILIQNDKEEE